MARPKTPEYPATPVPPEPVRAVRVTRAFTIGSRSFRVGEVITFDDEEIRQVFNSFPGRYLAKT